MLDCAVTLSLDVQGYMADLAWRGMLSLAQFAGIHSVDNSVVFGKYYVGLTVAARAIRVQRDTCRPST